MSNNIREDVRAYERSFGAQEFWVMVVYRFSRWHYSARPAMVRKLYSLIYHVLYKIVQVITGIELPCEVIAGRKFVIDHIGGIVISGYAKFGDNWRIRNGVVVGLRRMEEKFAPAIFNNIDKGSSAKVLGLIRIGDNVPISAIAVMLYDVLDNSIAEASPQSSSPPLRTIPTRSLL